MWFKNALVYSLTQRMELTEDSLRSALESKKARPCEGDEMSTFGFSPALGKHGQDLLHVVNGLYLIAGTMQVRKVPPKVVNEQLDEKVREIEAKESRTVRRKERDQYKDEIVQSLLPRAFVNKSTVRAIIAPEKDWIIVDASNPKTAEDLLSTLREVIGSLPVRPLSVKIAPSATLTEWLRSCAGKENAALSGGLVALGDCTMIDTGEDGGSINVKRQDLSSEEIQRLIESGKLVNSMSLAWSDKLTFRLDDKLKFKGLKFGDLLHDQVKADSDNAASEMDATFTLMSSTFTEFMPVIVEALGGLEIPQGI